MNPIIRFFYTYFIYVQIIYAMVNVMWWVKTPPETTLEWVALIGATFFTFLALLFSLIENLLIRNNPEKALVALLGICKSYPSLSSLQLINKLTIKYPFVPAKVFHQAFEQAIKEKYISGKKA